MEELKACIEKESIELVVWDFDGVLYDLDWNNHGTPEEFLEQLYDKITEIDDSVIKDKQEFITSLFPYNEINDIGLKYGKEVQLTVKDLYIQKEMYAAKTAKPHSEVISLIKELQVSQVIWSNNISSTIESLLQRSGIQSKISYISSFDKVLLSKPNEEGFSLIRKIYPDISKNKILFVGDSLRSDKVAAENTGIKFWHYVS